MKSTIFLLSLAHTLKISRPDSRRLSKTKSNRLKEALTEENHPKKARKRSRLFRSKARTEGGFWCKIVSNFLTDRAGSEAQRGATVEPEYMEEDNGMINRVYAEEEHPYIFKRETTLQEKSERNAAFLPRKTENQITKMVRAFFCS